VYPRFGPFGHVGTQITPKGHIHAKRAYLASGARYGLWGPFGAISCHMGPNRPIWPVFGLYLAYLAYMGPGRPKGSYLDPPGQKSELNGYKLATLRIGGPQNGQIRPPGAIRIWDPFLAPLAGRGPNMNQNTSKSGGYGPEGSQKGSILLHRTGF
jgi:hypothetical protein